MKPKMRPPTQAELDCERLYSTLIICTPAPPDFTAEDYLRKYAQGYFVHEDERDLMIMCGQIRENIPIPSRMPSDAKEAVKRGNYRVSTNRAFETVMNRCAKLRKTLTYKGEPYTENDLWIRGKTKAILRGLYLFKHAHSIEVWQGTALVGGALLLQIGGCIVSLSLFGDMPGAAKVAAATLQQIMPKQGFSWCDCVTPSNSSRAFGSHLVTLSYDLEHRYAAIQKNVEFPNLPVKPFMEHFPNLIQRGFNSEMHKINH